jgi:hypothetical protein
MRVLFAVAVWGLGHATLDLVLIKALHIDFGRRAADEPDGARPRCHQTATGVYPLLDLRLLQ